MVKLEEKVSPAWSGKEEKLSFNKKLGGRHACLSQSELHKKYVVGLNQGQIMSTSQKQEQLLR